MTDDRAELAASSWRNIVAWCRENAPVTAEALRGPASEEALAAAQVEMGYDWPAELLAWLRVGDGADRTNDANLIPSFIPMGVDRIMTNWRMLVEISADLETEDAVRAFESDVAGSYSGFIRSLIPFAEDTGGGFLIIDMRSGPKSRCIREWENGAAYPREPNWDSIASMLSDVDEALQTGQWGDDQTGRIPTVQDGALKWEHPVVPPGPEPEPRPLHDLRTQLILLETLSSDDAVAEILGLPADVVRKWRSRFIEDVSICDWPELAARHPVGSSVIGVVFSHHPFGIYVDVGIPFPGVLAADHLPPGPYPPVGSQIRAVVVSHEVGELHLDARPFADR